MRGKRKFPSRRRRRLPHWSYASNATLTMETNGATQSSLSSWILPPQRVNYLLDAEQGSSLTYCGSLIWKNAQYFNNSGTIRTPFYLYEYIIKAREDHLGNFTFAANPFGEPLVPSAITNWDFQSNEEGVGTDSYLYVNAYAWPMPGIPAQPMFTTFTTTDCTAASTSQMWGSAQVPSSGGDYCGFAGGQIPDSTFTRSPDHPAIHVKAKRRLQKDEGILYVMFTNDTFVSTESHQVFYDSSVLSRTLTRVNK